MFTRDQENQLWKNYVPEEERLAQMLEFVSQKGDDGLRQFIRCLNISGEKTPNKNHVELAELLEKQMYVGRA